MFYCLCRLVLVIVAMKLWWFRSPILFGKGGPVSGRVHPRIKQILRGVKQESNLRREAITRFSKRWRPWAVRMVRKQTLPRQVVVTADPALMDGEYLATCMHQAACRNTKDVNLWKGFIARLPDVMDEMSPEHFGYICWAVGKVQVPRKPNRTDQVHELLARNALKQLPLLTSHGMMAVLWTLKRALVKPSNDLLSGIASRIMDSPQSVRPSDYISICNSLAFFGFGKADKTFRDRISAISQAKFETDTFAQDFRAIAHPLTMANLWNDTMQAYILDRFRKIFITARPNHLLHAYHSSLVVRALASSVWFNLVSEKTRGFYTQLAIRHIASPSRKPCAFHKSVSDQLASVPFSVPHRNMFRWGPLFIDIGIEEDDSDNDASNTITDDRKTCVMLDKQTAFYSNFPATYTEKSILEHRLLTELGWDVCRVNQQMWKTRKNPQERIQILRDALETPLASI